MTDSSKPARRRIAPPSLRPRLAPAGGGQVGGPRQARMPITGTPRHRSGRTKRNISPRRGRALLPHEAVRAKKYAREGTLPERLTFPPAPKGITRFVPLGGLEEVGRNCSFFEYENEIVVVDAGIQFPEEETPGIDYIIPSVTDLATRPKNVRALILTHGHYDHIHALPYLIEKLGNPLIYAAALTKAIVEKRFEEFPNLPRPRFHVIKDGDLVQISEHFRAEFMDIEHTIPDAIGFILDTPAGKMVHFGDFRLETNTEGKPINLDVFERIGKMGVHSVFLDSTNALRDGHVLAEKTVEANLEALFKSAKGRIIVGTFASLLTRIGEIFNIAVRLGRKVALNGRSMVNNVQIAKNLGYLKFPAGDLIMIEEANNFPDHKVLILTTGAQGEPTAGLMKMATGEHRSIQLKPLDTVIFSSSIVPGNERSVQALQDNVARQVDNVFNSKLLDIHSSGHCHREDLKVVMELTKPKFVVPVHGYYLMRKMLKTLADEIGFSREKVMVLDNGQVADLGADTFTITRQEMPSYYVMVDGLGVGDVEEIVLRDRRTLAAEGMVVIIATVDKQKSRLVKNPDVITRGFIYIKENQTIINDVRDKVRALFLRIPTGEADTDYIKSLIRDQIGQFIFTKTKRRPMILPVMIEI